MTHLPYLRHLNRNQIAACKRMVRAYDIDLFYLAEACYWYCADWYDGQSCPLYLSLCSNPFRPSCLSDGPQEEPAIYLYQELEDWA